MVRHHHLSLVDGKGPIGIDGYEDDATVGVYLLEVNESHSEVVQNTRLVQVAQLRQVSLPKEDVWVDKGRKVLCSIKYSQGHYLMEGRRGRERERARCTCKLFRTFLEWTRLSRDHLACTNPMIFTIIQTFGDYTQPPSSVNEGTLLNV